MIQERPGERNPPADLAKIDDICRFQSCHRIRHTICKVLQGNPYVLSCYHELINDDVELRSIRRHKRQARLLGKKRGTTAISKRRHDSWQSSAVDCRR